DAQCYVEMIDPKAKRDGDFHKFNTRWKTKDCFRCTCSKQTIECCSLTLTPVGYDQEKCESVFDVESCSYQVRGKINPLQRCEVESWVI
uniref:Beta-microseminoprotein n=1 Tax=Gopherus agassizii TaxID=38772 RepID=A0A452HG89_9SAUR